MTTTQQPTHTDHAASQQPAVDPFEGVACSPDGIPLTVLKVLQRPDAFQLFLDVLLAEIGDNPTLRMRAHFLLMWGLAHGQYRLPDDAPSSRATTPPSSASPSPDDRAAGAERLAARRQADEQHMAARRHAHPDARPRYTASTSHTGATGYGAGHTGDRPGRRAAARRSPRYA